MSSSFAATSGVTLRKLLTTDRDDLAELANNRKVWNNVRNRMPHPYTGHDADQFIGMATSLENDQIVRAIIVGVIDGCDSPSTTNGSGGTFVGIIGLEPASDIYEGSAELGYWIGEPYWGRGYASDAVQQMIHIGFEEMGLRRIYSSVMDTNVASIRVLEKNGFQHEGTARAALVKNCALHDEHRYGLLATDLHTTTSTAAKLDSN